MLTVAESIVIGIGELSSLSTLFRSTRYTIGNFGGDIGEKLHNLIITSAQQSICCTNHDLHGPAPRYLSDYIQRVADSNRCRLRLSSSSQLVIRRTRLSTVGDRAFPVAGSRLWNSLPPDVTSAPMLTFSEPTQNIPFLPIIS